MTQPRREPQTEEEAQDLKRFLEQGAATSLEVQRMLPALRLPESLAQAAVVPFDVTGQNLLAELTTEENQLLLDIEITGVAQDEPPLLVFVNRPTATAETPATDPGFVGALAFFLPHQGMARFRLNATQSVREAAAVSIPLTVTLVPVPLPEAPVDVTSRVSRAEIQLVRSSVQLPS